MKTRSRSISIVVQSSIALMLLLATSSFNQGSSKLQEFKMTIKNTDDGLEINGLKGSAWTKLRFTINNYRLQAVDEYGMTEIDKSTGYDPKLADFLFTIAKTEDGIILKGLKGTGWKELTFTLAKGELQQVDQMGMTK
ncbi:hypothetical protein EZ456_04135 [Pedobacter psychrodurus]|uniref:Uncharacterized protein n=1 Tax=Pedobacter psychrodurus TaxID=2530456 RepID=A0A4R0Q0U1_9SPHI|nr:hypothetical protein [Pedobacter psychrodurus]TCD28586.1 hypothetical protein EZ456_04135 [Pedobacter psychrodurus]